MKSILLVIRKGCTGCQDLKATQAQFEAAHPGVNVREVDAGTTEGMGEAAWYDVHAEVPLPVVLVLNSEGSVDWRGSAWPTANELAG
jgi:hypothetical protein